MIATAQKSGTEDFKEMFVKQGKEVVTIYHEKWKVLKK